LEFRVHAVNQLLFQLSASRSLFFGGATFVMVKRSSYKEDKIPLTTTAVKRVSHSQRKDMFLEKSSSWFPPDTAGTAIRATSFQAVKNCEH
jgi:hypothetical protein